MSWDNFSQFIGEVITLSGGGALIAYGIFSFLGKKWLEKKFAEKLEEFKRKQDQQMEQYRFEINSLFNRILKVHEKEFEVLPTLWLKLQMAVGNVMAFTSPLQEYPDLDKLDNRQTDELLDKKGFTISQKEKIRVSINKNDNYRDMIFWIEYNKAAQFADDLHNYILFNKIFLSEDLFTSITQIDQILRGAMIDLEVAKDSGEPVRRSKIFMKIRKELPPMEDEIGKLIQQRLHYFDTK